MWYWKCTNCESAVMGIKPCYLITGHNYRPQVCPEDTETEWSEITKEEFQEAMKEE